MSNQELLGLRQREGVPVSAYEQNAAECLVALDGDLGELKRVVVDLQRQASARYHLAAIVDSAEDAIISKTLDGVIKSWNPGAERIFGYMAAEMIGQPVLKLLPKGQEHEELSILTRLRAGERIRGAEATRVRKDGSLVPVSLTVSPVFDAEGRIIGASKIARDISAERKSRMAREELIEKLQKALAEIKMLRGLIPICMHCKKVRDDKGFWQQLEAYFQRHADMRFSHGICPACAQERFGVVLPPDSKA